MKNRNKLITFAFIMAITFSFTACSKDTTKENTGATAQNGAETNDTLNTNTEDKDNITLSFWNVFTGSDGDILRTIVDNYNETNQDGITIEMDIMPNDTLQQKLPASIATETAPDMVLFGVENLASYVSNDSLEDISDFWQTENVDESNYLENVVELSYIDGKLYGVPMQYNVSYLYWNKDLFEAAGLDPNTPPTTLDELADYAIKLTDESKNQYGLALPSGTYPQFLWANGGDVDDSETETNLLNSDENLATLEWLQDLAANKKVTPMSLTGSDADTMLQNGQVAMYMSGPWQINGLREMGINFGITSIPAGSAGAFSPAGGCSYVIPKGIDDEKKQAVYKFMKYWLTDEILKEWSQKNGFPVWSKTLMEDEEIQNDEILSDISKATEIGRAYNLGYAKASQIDNDVIIPMFDKILLDAATPAEALQEASDLLDTVLALAQ